MRRKLGVAALVLLYFTLLLLFAAVPALAVPEEGRVGVIGCSNTKQGAEGYGIVSSEGRLWAASELNAYAGKTVEEWANLQAKVWRTVDRELEDHPDTAAVWWQLCIRTDEPTTLQTAETVLALIRQRTSVPIYASPLDATPTCRRSDEARASEFINQMMNAGQVLQGPIMTPLTSAQTQPDGCHANPAGLPFWGRDLAEFFDG